VFYWAASSPICDGLDFFGPNPAHFGPLKKKEKENFLQNLFQENL
jgi:hypothetical protein